MRKKTRLSGLILSAIFVLISGISAYSFLWLKPAYAGNDATGKFNVTLAQDDYSEDGDKGKTYSGGLGDVIRGDHDTYDGHINFFWVNVLFFGNNLDDWARGRISGIEGKLTGSADDCTFTFTVAKTDKRGDVKDDDNYGKGMITLILYKNGEEVKSSGSKGNCDMSDSINRKPETITIGDLTDNAEYRIYVQVRFKVGDSAGSYATYQGHWDYYFTPKQVTDQYSQSLSSGEVAYKNGIHYYNRNFNFSWVNGNYDTNRVGNDIFYKPTAYAEMSYNGASYQNYDSDGTKFEDGKYDLRFFNARGTTIGNYTIIKDTKAPEPSFSKSSTNNIYPVGTKVSYSYNSDREAPITKSTYSRKEITVNENGFTVGETVKQNVYFSSGSEFKESGIYTIVLEDLCGNSTTKEFCVVNQTPNYNYRRATTSGYLKPDVYKVTIPYLKSDITINTVGKDGQASKYAGVYTNSKTYIFSSEENAIRFMCEIELAECVTFNDYTNTYEYKQKNNPNGSSTYNSVSELWEVLEYYAKKSVKNVEDTTLNSEVYIDKSTVIMDDDALDINTKDDKELFFIDDSFIFKQYCVTSGSYEYRSLKTIKITTKNEILFDGSYTLGKKLSEYIIGKNNAGVINITETDSCGNTCSWTACYDVGAPNISADYEYYEVYTDEDGYKQNNVLSKSVTIYSGNEIGDRNLKSFSITEITDVYDKFVFAQVLLPNNQIETTRDISKLKFGVKGFYETGGEYRVKVYDRSLNFFEYVFVIAGSPPKVSSWTQGTGENKTMTISFANGSTYSSIVSFTIFRYEIALPENDKYIEYDDNGNVINVVTISQNVFSYTFYKGGVYKIRFVDSFHQVTESEIVFKKGLPAYELTGVTEKGKTKKAVSITFNSTVGYILKLNGEEMSGLGSEIDGGYKIEIPATPEYNGNYDVKLYKKNDELTYITFSFVIDTIPPIAKAYKEDGSNLNWGTYISTPFKLDWDISENIERVKYTIDNGYVRTYAKGTVLTENGRYVFTVTDDVGNSSTYEIELDTTVKYSIAYSGNNYSEDDITYVKTGFTLTGRENNLRLTIIRDGEEITSRFSELYSGEGTYEILITDYIGNSVLINVVVDKTAPNIVVTNTGNEYEPVNVSLPISDIDTYKLKYNGQFVTKEITDVWNFSDWGEYQITVADKLGNSITQTFTIRKYPPVISIYDINNVELENGVTVNNGVYFVWDDENATGSISVDGISKTYVQNTVITSDGVYTLTVTDEAKNKVSVSVSIVKALKFTFIVANGARLETIKVGDVEKTKEPFTLSCSGLNVSVKKDGQAFTFIVGQQISVDGIYEFHIYDDIGNFEDRTIVFDSTAPALSFAQGTDLTDSVTVTLDTTDVKKVKVIFKSVSTVTTEYFPENEYLFSDWGTYTITATDYLGNSSTVSFEIKKALPEISFQTLSGRVLNRNELSNEAFVLDYDEDLVIKYCIDNNYSVVYRKGTILREQGTYNFVITDLANNSIDFQVSLDCDIKFSVIVDGQTVKNFNDIVVGKRYFELTLGEPLTASYSFNGRDADILTETVKRFEDEGVYEIVLVDVAQNSFTMYFKIDKTAPICAIDTTALTKSDVVFTVDDLNDIALYKIRKDGISLSKFILQKTNTFDEEGKYSITVQDYLANKRVLEFEIKRNINYKMSVADGFITDGKVTLSIKENDVRITAVKDGKEIELANATEFEFTDAGIYAVTISDSIGNSKTVNFTLDATKYRKSFAYNIPFDSQISLLKNGKEIDVDNLIDGDILTVTDDGEYVLTLKKNGVSSTYNFVIDTIVPSLIINGREVKAGEPIDVFKTDITLSSSKKNSTMKVYYNGDEVVYNSTESLSAPGQYKVVITDAVGNVVEYEFERAFTLNTGSIILIIMFVLAIVLVCVLIIRRRLKMKIV